MFSCFIGEAQLNIMATSVDYKMNSIEEGFSIGLGVMFLLITCFGVPINIAAIKTLKKQTSNHLKLMEQIPISMCVCNIIHMFPIYLLHALCAFYRKWILGLPICQFMGFWVHFNGNSSIWHLVLYALEQRRLVCSDHNINPAMDNTAAWKKYAKLSFAWLHGLFWSIIPFSGWCGYQYEGLGLSCSVTWEYTDAGSLTYTISILIFNFIFPMVIIINCYTKIFLKFKTHVDCQSSSIVTSAQARNKVKLRKLAVIVCFMSGSFIFAWAPYAGVAVYMLFTQRRAHPILVTLPAGFAKCSVVIFPIFILLKKSVFKLGEVHRRSPRQITN